MSRKTGLIIKKEILAILKKEGECSLRELEIKINTNNLTIRKHIEELAFLGHVKVIEHESNERNGRPFTSIILHK
jgi:predicted ArsR family transcriptional regulator